jgi:hypothetical protein
MTAAMRAVTPAVGPKVLRVAVVVGGRVSEERLVKHRTDVTVGPSEGCTFALSDPGLPSSFRLFERRGSDYYLRWLDGWSGRVAMAAGTLELGALQSQTNRCGDGAYEIRLTDESRGKVIVGSTALLFQFVSPPPVQCRPQLPMSARSALTSQVDWRFTIVASFSFLFHFGAAGMLYSDWMDREVNDPVATVGLIEQVKSLPATQQQQQQQQPERPEPEPPMVEPREPDGEPPVPRPGSRKPEISDRGGGLLSPERRAALADELERLDVATLGALGGKASATEGVLRGGDVPTGSLDRMAASGSGVSVAGTSGLNLGGGGQSKLGVGEVGGGLAGIGNTSTSPTGSAGAASTVAGPRAVVTANASVAGGAVRNAERIVAGLKARFRGCYNDGIRTNPEMSGSVRLTASIGPNGEVLSASASRSGNVSAQVAACMVSHLRGSQFDPPEGGAATVVVPVILVQQR